MCVDGVYTAGYNMIHSFIAKEKSTRENVTYSRAGSGGSVHLQTGSLMCSWLMVLRASDGCGALEQ